MYHLVNEQVSSLIPSWNIYVFALGW